MKQLTCEMCGSTDLVKQDGFFICQTCGCKYSVEEAKKMMIEGTVDVQGSVNVQNAAQLENLLKLAHSSFDSKNYAQAEEFCNQVIAMDDKNYDAWKLKGMAINYQISSKKQRILEVYNCIMTSYRVLDDQQKLTKRVEIITLLQECFEGEIDFWLKQFEANRPTDASLTRAKNAYIDSYNKMAAAFDELELSALKKQYLTNLENFFVKKANSICVSAWSSTVAYNYYREDLATLGSKWGTGNAWSRLVTTDTDSYRPLKKTWQTFIEEGDNLIELLKFAEKQFNGNTSYKLKEAVYENMIFYHEKLSNALWYEIGTSGNEVGWLVAGRMSDEGKKARQDIIDIIREQISLAKKLDDYARKAKIEEKCKDSDVDSILTQASANLSKKEFLEAEARFNVIIRKLPNSPIGYVGKSVSIFGANGNNALEHLREAAQHTPSNDKERNDLRFFIDYKFEDGSNLLMHAALYYDYESVKYLVDSGADINVTASGTTALWCVCHKKPDEANVANARQIAKLLLDKGAQIDVTSASGISLYNKETDSEIANMITEKYPDVKLGKAKKSGGCYVATCVYGSYDCPQVWTLRRFRDDTLGSTWYGRSFIHTYYAISPTLVKWFGDTTWFKKLWKGTLDRMVDKLQSEGVEDSPYEDKEWQ